METAACAVGRLAPDGPWIGFAPTLDDGYALVVGGPVSGTAAAGPDDLLSLAVAYFEEALSAPPDELAATHADIGALVRHLAVHEEDAERRRRLGEAVDAVDDGLAADVVVSRLDRCLREEEEPLTRLLRRAREIVPA